jgi:hypothetical protein
MPANRSHDDALIPAGVDLAVSVCRPKACCGVTRVILLLGMVLVLLQKHLSFPIFAVTESKTLPCAF